jgi:hypothetical protein
MRVIITGDRNWYAPELAAEVVKRLLLEHGPGLVIVHGAATSYTVDSGHENIRLDPGANTVTVAVSAAGD